MLYDVAIIGAGVIGGMLARELSRYDLSVSLLEKDPDLEAHPGIRERLQALLEKNAGTLN